MNMINNFLRRWTHEGVWREAELNPNLPQWKFGVRFWCRLLGFIIFWLWVVAIGFIQVMVEFSFGNMVFQLISASVVVALYTIDYFLTPSAILYEHVSEGP